MCTGYSQYMTEESGPLIKNNSSRVANTLRLHLQYEEDAEDFLDICLI